MSEIVYPGGQVMIRIDGTKIRQIREQKGLTQLYIATAVEVTTDTVSRWENKRYPSIKKENALKLAQALEVDLSELMESESEPITADTRLPADPEVRQNENTGPLLVKHRFYKKNAKIFIGISVFLSCFLSQLSTSCNPVLYPRILQSP